MTISYFNTMCIVIAISCITLYLRWVNKRINKVEEKQFNAICDKTLRKLISKGKIIITGLEDEDIQPASIDIRISNDFLRMSNLKANIEGEDVDIEQDIYIGKGKPVHYESYSVSNNDWFCINPGEFVLASARSYLKMPTDIVAFIQGKYSVGRQGLLVQNTGIVDPGYEGKITLELVNITKSKIYIKPGQNVAQIIFFYLDSNASNPYHKVKLDNIENEEKKAEEIK